MRHAVTSQWVTPQKEHVAELGATMDISADGWFHETLDGPRCEFACIQYRHFGFALPRKDVEGLSERLASLLEMGQCHNDNDSVLFVDWSQEPQGSVMIAFRPDHDCQGRYYDIPKDAASTLLVKLRRLLER